MSWQTHGLNLGIPNWISWIEMTNKAKEFQWAPGLPGIYSNHRAVSLLRTIRSTGRRPLIGDGLDAFCEEGGVGA